VLDTLLHPYIAPSSGSNSGSESAVVIAQRRCAQNRAQTWYCVQAFHARSAFSAAQGLRTCLLSLEFPDIQPAAPREFADM
jgi:hypothetical protein